MNINQLQDLLDHDADFFPGLLASFRGGVNVQGIDRRIATARGGAGLLFGVYIVVKWKSPFIEPKGKSPNDQDHGHKRGFTAERPLSLTMRQESGGEICCIQNRACGRMRLTVSKRRRKPHVECRTTARTENRKSRHGEPEWHSGDAWGTEYRSRCRRLRSCHRLPCREG